MTRVAILGMGLIGTSIALRLKREAGDGEMRIIGHDRYRGPLKQAKDMGAIDDYEGDVRKAVRDAEIVILAAPPLANRRLLEQIAEALPDDAIVTDVGSTKGDTMRHAAKVLPSRVAFVGGHPMAGKTETGPEAADADLFEGARWVVVAPPNAPPRAVRAVLGLAEMMGAEPMLMDADEHDAYVAAVSHMPMAVATALYRLARRSEAWPELSLLASGGFKDTTRLTATEASIAYDMYATNRDQVVHWIDRMIETLREHRDAVAHADDEALFKLLAETQHDYELFRAGKIGREVEAVGPDPDAIGGFGFSSFLMGDAIRERMSEITKAAEDRLRQAEEAERQTRRL